MNSILTNPYTGINAHLHSLFQIEGGWNGFHTVHIGDLYKALTAQLLPMGYVAGIEESLQIRRVGDAPRYPRADVLVFDTDPSRSSPSILGNQTQTIPLLELLDDHELSEKPFRAITIYEVNDRTNQRGMPVAWLELLSPSNKGDSDDAEAYRAKRMALLASGLVFIELDYLHETAPTFHTIAPYRPTAEGEWIVESHAYRILVIDPRPQFEQGRAQVIGFDVGQAIPKVTIPLNGDDTVRFDFNAPYQKTFTEGFFGRTIDYENPPRNFERYSPADRVRILEAVGTP